MKEITVITTGGTIGSLLDNDHIAVDVSEKRIANEIRIAKNELGCSVVVDSSLNKHSEDLAPVDWAKILQSLQVANNSDATGIVVTHGTDTLAYSVAAALAFRDLWTKKICFTASYYAPSDPSSDTSLSLLAALDFVSQSQPTNGVFVAFRSNQINSKARIIYGASLKPMQFDDLYFNGAYEEYAMHFSLKDGLSEDFSMTTTNSPYLGVGDAVPSESDIAKAQQRVGMISLYPGIDTKMLKSASFEREILIIQMYHSGTGPASESNEALLRFIRDNSPSVKICMATYPKRYIEFPYESTQKISEAGAYIYFDLQAHFLYVFSILGLSVGLEPSDLIDKLSGFEVS